MEIKLYVSDEVGAKFVLQSTERKKRIKAKMKALVMDELKC